MKVLYINKPDGNDYIVLLMQHKITREWSFVNLTKEHICPCKFKTYEEAIDDLEQHVKDGRVSAWHFIDLPISKHVKNSEEISVFSLKEFNSVNTSSALQKLYYNNIRCPKCGGSYYTEMHSMTTAAYYPPVYKDGVNINPDRNKSTTHCRCLNCNNEFDI